MTEELLALLALFEKSKGPLSARRIAEKTKTYPATAHRRVEALKKELKARGGKQLKAVDHREGKRGPSSTAWILA